MTQTRHSTVVVLLVGLLGTVAAVDNLESLASVFNGENRRLGGVPEELRIEMFAAHKCHSSCGKDAACHSKCPKPLKPLVEACRQAPAVMVCQEKCAGDAACTKACPSFTMDWIQKRFEKNPTGFSRRYEWICPRIESAYACHQACTPGEHMCHRKCPRVWGHGDRHRGRHEEMKKDWASTQIERSSTCNSCLASGKDFCISESKCIPRATFNCKGPHDHITGDRWFALHGNPEGIQHKMSCPETETKKGKSVKPDAKGCYDKGKHGVWCPEGDGWYCAKNCMDDVEKVFKPDAKRCYDKGKYGVWCPKGDDWYCVKNCKAEFHKLVKPDAKGCYDKGKHGVWCPKDDDWYCVKNCKEESKAGFKWLSAIWKVLSHLKSLVSDLLALNQAAESKEIVV